MCILRMPGNAYFFQGVIMKKIISIILVFILIFTLASCGSKENSEEENARALVERYCENLKAFDIGALKEETAGKSISKLEVKLDIVPEEFIEDMKGWAQNIEYSIEDFSLEELDGSATVKFKYTDATKVMEKASAEYKDYASLKMGQDYLDGYHTMMGGSGKKSSANIDEEIDAFLLSCLRNAVESEGVETAEKTIEIDFVKYQGDWRVKTFSDDLFMIITSNVFILAED